MARDFDSSDDTPVFFIHVMKTAGTSLWINIKRNFDEDEVYPQAGIDLDGTSRLSDCGRSRWVTSGSSQSNGGARSGRTPVTSRSSPATCWASTSR